MLLQFRSDLQSKTQRALLDGALSAVAARNDPIPSTRYVDYEMCVKIRRSVLSRRGKRGGPLSSANSVGALLRFALFSLAFGDFAFAFCLAFTLSHILGRHLFRFAFSFFFGLGLLRVAFGRILGLHLFRITFAFGLGIFGISFLLVDLSVGRLLFVTHLFSRDSPRSQEHRSNQHT